MFQTVSVLHVSQTKVRLPQMLMHAVGPRNSAGLDGGGEASGSDLCQELGELEAAHLVHGVV